MMNRQMGVRANPGARLLCWIIGSKEGQVTARRKDRNIQILTHERRDPFRFPLGEDEVGWMTTEEASG